MADFLPVCAIFREKLENIFDGHKSSGQMV